jgi:hypothetical protein
MRELNTRMDRIFGAREVEPTGVGGPESTVPRDPFDLVTGPHAAGGHSRG